MNKKELVKAIMTELGTSKEETREFLDAYILVVSRQLAQGETVTISNFHTLRPEWRNARDPHDPTSFRLQFRAAPRLTEMVRNRDDRASLRRRSHHA